MCLSASLWCHLEVLQSSVLPANWQLGLEVHQIWICLLQDHVTGGDVYFHQEVHDLWLSLFSWC